LTDDSPLALALVMMSFALPLTFASLIGGTLADRVDRKRVIVVSQAGNALLTLLLAVLDATGAIRFWHLMVIGFANGTLAAFNMPSRNSIISDLVPGKDLMNAISLNSAGMNMTRMVGPAAAGVLIVYLDTWGVFFLIVGIHVLSVACMAMIGGERRPAGGSGRGMLADVAQGFRYARQNSTLFCLVIMTFVPSLIGFPYLALLPAWAREALNVRADELGALLTCMGMGSVLGTLILASLREMKRRGAFLTVNSLVWGGSLLVFSRCGSFSTALPMLFLVGLLSSVFMALNMTLLQAYSSAEMRGRMVSMAMMTFGIMPLSAVPFGAVAERIGTADSLAIAGVILALFSVVFFFAFPRFRKVA
ncbi:MAG: MFS transporter, partial [Deltaproteobacteria bacterium]|nr:MFS transporter [Deltaproteobacteria bacterium]